MRLHRAESRLRAQLERVSGSVSARRVASSRTARAALPPTSHRAQGKDASDSRSQRRRGGSRGAAEGAAHDEAGESGSESEGDVLESSGDEEGDAPLAPHWTPAPAVPVNGPPSRAAPGVPSLRLPGGTGASAAALPPPLPRRDTWSAAGVVGEWTQRLVEYLLSGPPRPTRK